MNIYFARVALCVSLLLASSGAMAQDSGAAGAPAMPGVQSADILDMNQNQAERTRDQPGNLAPTWRIVKDGTNHTSTLPGKEMGVLIQQKAQFPGQTRAVTAGEAWRQYRNGPLTNIGAWLLGAALLGMIAFYFIAGPIRTKKPRTGRLIERFTSFERVVHWTTALTFVLLAFTGLAMLFGRHVVLPLLGHTWFGWLAYLCKNLHNFAGPVFAASLLLTFAIFVKDNFPQWIDFKWLMTLGRHAHAGRFNGGEKLWFWGGVTALGLIVSASGFALAHLLPGLDPTRGNMQVANVIHLAGAVLFMAASLGHIYLGTIGMEGAYAAMRTGYVDDTWAREHHDLWYEDIQDGKVARVRTREDADAMDVPATRAL